MAAAVVSPRFEPDALVAGKFRLRKRLAAGGMGEVWMAKNESTGADVALKILRRGAVAPEEELEIEARFRHEARLSAMLSHRSIVKVFDLVEEEDGTLVLVMELLRGETLLAHVGRKGPRPAREAVALIVPILGALAHAHALGIVHRDVTPANVFLAVDPDGRVTPKLVDFGIAKLAGHAAPISHVQPVTTVDGSVLGTPRYMAPERIRGSADIDGRIDVFSAGVVLYEMLTGVSPFAATTPTASLAAVLERRIERDPCIEPRLWVEIERAISRHPSERHASAQELAAALRTAIGESEGELEASLKGTEPAPGWDEEHPGVVADQPQVPGKRPVVARRRIVGSATAWWLVAGAAVGALVALGAFELRAPAPLAPSGAASAVTPPAPSFAPVPPPPTRAPVSAAVPSRAPAPAPSPSPRATTVPSTSSAPPRPRPRPVLTPAPRPIATTPGF